MKFDATLPKRIILLVLLIGVLAAYPLFKAGDREITVGFITGCLISLVSVTVGYLLIEYGIEKPNATFLKIILGGMVVRLILIPVVVVVLIRIFQFHLVSLTASLFLSYFLFLIVEILFLNKKLALKKVHL
jgi:F0F1-type ATP synthase assembly protein I